jgi:hypothetical protein
VPTVVAAAICTDGAAGGVAGVTVIAGPGDTTLTVENETAGVAPDFITGLDAVIGMTAGVDTVLAVTVGAGAAGGAVATTGWDGGATGAGGASSRACCGGTTGGVGMSLFAGCFGAGVGAADAASATTVGLVGALIAAVS